MTRAGALALLFWLAQITPRAAVAPARPAAGPMQEPDAVLHAESTWAGADVLWPLASSGDIRIAFYAIRAIGRLEDPVNVPGLLALAQKPGARPGAAGPAIARSLNGFDPARDPELIASVAAWLQVVTFVDAPKSKSIMPGPIGSIRWASAEQVHGAEDVLGRLLKWAAYDKTKAATYLGAVRALESLARLNIRVTSFAPDTVLRLSRIVANSGANDGDAARESAVAALVAARALDAETELIALRDPDAQVRRLAVAALAGSGAGLDETRRLDLLGDALADRDGQVRYEAVRGYVRRSVPSRGCGPLLDRASDGDTHVALAAIDALGEFCKDDDGVTARLISEAAVPQGLTWHRQAHAFVALAKRAPERAAMTMGAFAAHPSWWVRMYAARAAGAAGDVARLEKLAYDASDNVREAALGPLRRLTHAGADAAIVAALDRTDVQLVRTAALLLKESPASARTGVALVASLLRLTAEGKETSRDARVPLLEAIAVHAAAAAAPQLAPLLKDADPVVAAKAASVLAQLTGRSVTAEPAHITRGWPRQFADLRQCVTVSLGSGASFRMAMDPGAAPIAVDRFLKLAVIDHYYDGLTIHRIVPNFVIQGGSPGANEYAGHKEYMRDEVGRGNLRGTVGLSTRGRNTADAQFYINLVDNPRLDADYTVFASVLPADMAVVDRIEEGDAMRLSMARCGAT